MNDLNANALTKDALADLFEADGYSAGKPRHVSAAALAIDSQVAAESTCEECGNHGLEMLPFRENAGRGYRCLVWCSACDCAFEM